MSNTPLNCTRLLAACAIALSANAMGHTPYTAPSQAPAQAQRTDPHYTASFVRGPQGESAGADAINARGDVTGSWRHQLNTPHVIHGFVTRGSVVRSFMPFGSTHVNGTAISSKGDVAGYMYYRPGSTGQETFLRKRDGSLTHLQLNGVGNVNGIDAYGVNASGVVAGTYLDASFNFVAFSWKDGVTTTYPSTLGGPQSHLYAINDAGLMVGSAEKRAWDTRAVSWSAEGKMTKLPGLEAGGRSAAYGVSAQGWIVGGANLSGNSHATLWRDGTVFDLGVAAGDHWSSAQGINASGTIVGSGGVDSLDFHPVIWLDNVAHDLRMLTTLPDGATMLGALGIADNGTILVNGKDADGLFVSLLLKPDTK